MFQELKLRRKQIRRGVVGILIGNPYQGQMQDINLGGQTSYEIPGHPQH